MKQIVLLIALLGCGCSSFHHSSTDTMKTNMDPCSHYVPPGLLGYPVGTYLTVEGVAGQTKGGIRVLVETVNGQPLTTDTHIHVNSIYVTEKTRCKIKGYETGVMAGEPPAFTQSGAESDPKWQLTQLNKWQFWRYFVPMSIEYPEELGKQLTAKEKPQQSPGGDSLKAAPQE